MTTTKPQNQIKIDEVQPLHEVAKKVGLDPHSLLDIAARDSIAVFTLSTTWWLRKANKCIKNQLVQLEAANILELAGSGEAELIDYTDSDWALYNEPGCKISLRQVYVRRKDLKLFMTDTKNGAGEKKASNRGSVRHKDRARIVAKTLWMESPDKTITSVVKHPAFLEIACEGAVYTENMKRGWVNDLCPNRKAGRRPRESPRPPATS